MLRCRPPIALLCVTAPQGTVPPTLGNTAIKHAKSGSIRFLFIMIARMLCLTQLKLLQVESQLPYSKHSAYNFVAILQSATPPHPVNNGFKLRSAKSSPEKKKEETYEYAENKSKQNDSSTIFDADDNVTKERSSLIKKLKKKIEAKLDARKIADASMTDYVDVSKMINEDITDISITDFDEDDDDDDEGISEVAVQ